MSRKFDAIVVGSGLGGLTAGALYARAGHRVLVLERNRNFGGAATIYQHGELTIEASLHETTDPHDIRDPKNKIFHALGILDDIEFIPVGDLFEVRSALLGEPFVLSHGLHTTKVSLQNRFPVHKKSIHRLFNRLESMGDTMALFSEKHTWIWWFLHAPTLPFHLWPVLRDVKKSLAEVFQRLFGDDEAIKMVLAANLSYYADDPEQMWWTFYALAQGGYLSNGGYYIRGGSQALSNRLVEVIEEEGGIAEAERVVTRIILDEEGRAKGVEHQNSDDNDIQREYAPVVFGNAAPHVLAKALPSDARDAFMKPYASESLSVSLFSISLGLTQRPAKFGVTSYSTIIFPDWMTSLSDYRNNAELLNDQPGERMPMLTMVDYSCIDTGLNTEPPYLMAVTGLDRIDNWENLTKQQYDERRNQWLNAIIQALDKEFPGLATVVTVKEMATARTMHNYLNTPGGALYGFAPRPPQHLLLKGPPHTPKTTIDGLWLASAFAGFGGYTGAMMSGATAAQAAISGSGMR